MEGRVRRFRGWKLRVSQEMQKAQVGLSARVQVRAGVSSKT